MTVYVGVNGVAEKVKRIYVGENGENKRITKVYAGVNGVARMVYGVTLTLVSIPTMTDNITPSGNAVSSNNISTAWKAFDKNGDTRWLSRLYGDDPNRWIYYDFGYEIQPIKGYVKNSATHSNAYAFVIAGSKDAVTWTDLYEYSTWNKAFDAEFQINTSEEFRYFRYLTPKKSNTYQSGVYEFNIWGYKEEII